MAMPIYKTHPQNDIKKRNQARWANSLRSIASVRKRLQLPPINILPNRSGNVRCTKNARISFFNLFRRVFRITQQLLVNKRSLHQRLRALGYLD